jgi:hypothetical protein
VAELTVADYEEMDKWHKDVVSQLKIVASNQATTHDMLVKRIEKLEERLEQVHKADVTIIGFMQEINHFMNDTVNILANGITPDGTDVVSKIQEIAGTVRKIDANNQEAYRILNERTSKIIMDHAVILSVIARIDNFMIEFVQSVDEIDAQGDDTLSDEDMQLVVRLINDLTKVVAADDTSPSTKKRKKK